MHVYGRTLLWDSMCFFRSNFLLRHFPHSGHEYGFSPGDTKKGEKTKKKQILVKNGNYCSETIISGMARWGRPCLTSVDPAVLGQVTGQGEGLPTVLTDVRPLTCVRPHVLL